MKHLLVLFGLGLLLWVGCQQSTPVPTKMSAVVTATFLPNDTGTPTIAPSPTPTASPIPTIAPTPRQLATSTPTITMTQLLVDADEAAEIMAKYGWLSHQQQPNDSPDQSVLVRVLGNVSEKMRFSEALALLDAIATLENGGAYLNFNNTESDSIVWLVQLETLWGNYGSSNTEKRYYVGVVSAETGQISATGNSNTPFLATATYTPITPSQQRISFLQGATVFASSHQEIVGYGADEYLLTLQQGQTIGYIYTDAAFDLSTVAMTTAGEFMSIAEPLPETGDYVIRVINPHANPVAYQLFLEIPALVQFPEGQTTVTYFGRFVDGGIPPLVNRYFGYAQLGQRLQVTVDQPSCSKIDLPLNSVGGAIGAEALDIILNDKPRPNFF
ncbi:MAG TPA: hypothetical protein ENJ56_02755, partial [Anaerolineae bacterium]|nr:hypothetical protein [Anaerolineae bacterium]